MLEKNKYGTMAAGNVSGRGVVWSEEETTALLQIWNKEHIKQQLSTTHRNAKVFLQFSVHMKAKGFIRTALMILTTLISSVLEQQRRDYDLFILKEDERHCREMELQ